MNLTITADGVAYDFASIKDASNRDAMALEAALGVTYENFMKRLRKRLVQIGEDVKAAKAAVPEGVEPDLSEVDTSLSALDTTAIVFLARRRAGERDLKFDDVDFTLVECRFGADGADEEQPSDAGEPPDANADPTAGSSGPTLEPNAGPSPQVA